jgi:NADH-quinone oxidoreductase subunit E
MLPPDLRKAWMERIHLAEHPRELAVDVMLALQEKEGYLSDEALVEAAQMLGMTPLELEELATFYDFLYREPVGRYVIRVCDSVVCWMEGGESLAAHLSRRLGISMGETTEDGLFTLLPVCCLGYCDMAPAILVNRNVHGNLTPKKIDQIIGELKQEAGSP